MRVFGYVRVSTAEQASNGDSLDTQRQQINGYAMMKGWQVAEFFIEGGVSGSVVLADRPEGKRLLSTLAAGDVVITSRLDRAFRSAADALVTLEEFKDQGIGLHMIDLGGDVCGNGISKLVFTILSAVAENERDRIRERIRDVKRHLASQGIYGGGKRPFGYDVIKAEGKDPRTGKKLPDQLVPNATEQAALARMKALRSEGATQDQALGGLDAATRTLLQGLARGQKPEGRRRLKPGTVLVREYQGERHTVTVVPGGFVWREATYASLSNVARAITGTAWNGPRFFGLRDPGNPSGKHGVAPAKSTNAPGKHRAARSAGGASTGPRKASR